MSARQACRYCLVALSVRRGEVTWRACGAESAVLSLEFGVPDLACPGVLGEDGHEDDGGLVVDAPGGESLSVEGAFELGVEAFGVLAHAVEATVLVAVGADDAEVLGAVELGCPASDFLAGRF